mmetsp:Transcript_36908/g.104155  ORF Transcript_36908/g.104155 Transcript_36908/m.104155 type:complete len:603 (+) Transcript_36908:215-2023(+)
MLGVRNLRTALLIVAFCYLPMMYLHLWGKLEEVWCLSGCTDNSFQQQGAYVQAGVPGSVAPEQGVDTGKGIYGPREGIALAQMEAWMEGDPLISRWQQLGQVSEEEGEGGEEEKDEEVLPGIQQHTGWETYLEAALKAITSQDCKFAVPQEIIITRAPQQGTGAPAGQGYAQQQGPEVGVEESCTAMEVACTADAKCHEGPWAVELAKETCSKKSQAVCRARFGSRHVAMPHHCASCVAAAKADRISCRRTGQRCEEQQAACYNARQQPTGGNGTLEWLSFWDEGHYEPAEFKGWANFGFSKDVASICRGAAMGQRHLLKVGASLFGRSPVRNSKGKKRLRLLEDWEERWVAFRPVASALLEGGAIFGVFLGDELLWSGLSIDQIEAAAARIRADLPGAVIWMNEARAPIQTGSTQFQGVRFTIPPSVSWISVDDYHYTPDPGYVWDLRRLHYRHIYPLLRPNQSVVLVPGAFASHKNTVCNETCYDKFMAEDAEKIAKWAQQDKRVLGIVPYHWNFCDHCRGTRNEIGVKQMHGTREKWRAIGRQIVEHQNRLVGDRCSCAFQGRGEGPQDETSSNRLLRRCLASGGVMSAPADCGGTSGR